ncbi:hypothetical protein, unlikely [Trypanosoma congolense IL3000]|uniref:Uncharacterized protein n=1 Tax=Trypanosoma congolense (strain IL3000) TaxID=1068625 RepID=F9WIF5_TRYCI|nr:hypothetical protein, unlikely [Trypanosoma congolense IL3000]
MTKNRSNSENNHQKPLFGQKTKKKKNFFLIFLRKICKKGVSPGKPKKVPTRITLQNPLSPKNKKRKKYFFCFFWENLEKKWYFTSVMQKNSSNSEITTKNTLFGPKNKKRKKFFFLHFFAKIW